MLKNDKVPVLTDLIEKGIEIKLSELGLDTNQDLVFEVDEREEPQIDVTQLELDDDPKPNTISDNPVLEQKIRRILDEHMELAVQEIKLAISQASTNERD